MWPENPCGAPGPPALVPNAAIETRAPVTLLPLVPFLPSSVTSFGSAEYFLMSPCAPSRCYARQPDCPSHSPAPGDTARRATEPAPRRAHARPRGGLSPKRLKYDTAGFHARVRASAGLSSPPNTVQCPRMPSFCLCFWDVSLGCQFLFLCVPWWF